MLNAEAVWVESSWAVDPVVCRLASESVMRRTSALAMVVLLFSALAPPAFAQGAYVGAFLVGEIVRLDQYDSRAEDSGSGESLGFALRLGSPIGTKWGVELEFVRPGEITSNQLPQIFPAIYDVQPIQVIPGLPNRGVNVSDPAIFPPISYEFRSAQRRSTLSTSLWVRQEISPRVSMVYLGGVAFGRTSNEVEITYTISRPTILPLPPISPVINESISYDVQPMVGVEGRIRMGGKVDLVPGLRLHGAQGGWLIRPAVGLSWNF
jgi:hypothetical protein